MTWPSRGLGDHRRENTVRQRSDPVLLCPLPRLSISGTVSAPIQTPGRVSPKDGHLNLFCGFCHQINGLLNCFLSLESPPGHLPGFTLRPTPRPPILGAPPSIQSNPRHLPAAHPSPLPLTSHSLSPRLLPPTQPPSPLPQPASSDLILSPGPCPLSALSSHHPPPRPLQP